MKIIKAASLLVTILLVSGCTTMADSIAAKGTGPHKIYDRPKPEVWPVVIEAVNSVGLELVTANESSSMVLAQRGITAFSYGENVAIFVEDYSNQQCRVEVVSKKSMETNVIAPDWSKSIFEYLDSRFE